MNRKNREKHPREEGEKRRSWRGRVVMVLMSMVRMVLRIMGESEEMVDKNQK